MRTTDDPEPRPIGPLGERVMPKTPQTPSEPVWKPKPGAKGIEVNERGELRTNIDGAWK